MSHYDEQRMKQANRTTVWPPNNNSDLLLKVLNELREIKEMLCKQAKRG
jgi:hypothetical protein